MLARPTAVTVILLLLGASFAGCLNRAPAGDDDAPEQALSPEQQLALDRNATLNMTDDGTKAGNETLGHMPHLHDYWQGKERVTLFDEDVEIGPFDALGFSFFQVFIRHNPAIGGAFVRLPDGATVFEGTGQLELTASWTDSTITGMSARYRTAAGTTWSEPTPLASGTPLVVPVTPEMTDMPHVSTSRWAFLFEPPAAGSAMVGTFRLKIDIVKMRDIGLFPGHPELFEGKSEKIILEGDGQSKQDNFATMFAGFLVGGGPDQEGGLAAQQVVPMETQEMRAEVTLTSVTTTTGGEVANVYLLVKTADRNGFEGYEAIDSESDPAKGLYVFAIPVEMRNVDSPYAKDSQWRFDVWVTSNVIAGTNSACGGCSDTQVSYHMLVTAYDHTILTNGTEDEGEEPGAAAVAASSIRSAPGPSAPQLAVATPLARSE